MEWQLLAQEHDAILGCEDVCLSFNTVFLSHIILTLHTHLAWDVTKALSTWAVQERWIATQPQRLVDRSKSLIIIIIPNTHPLIIITGRQNSIHQTLKNKCSRQDFLEFKRMAK